MFLQTHKITVAGSCHYMLSKLAQYLFLTYNHVAFERSTYIWPTCFVKQQNTRWPKIGRRLSDAVSSYICCLKTKTEIPKSNP